MSMLIIWKMMWQRKPTTPIGAERVITMFEIKYLVWIWKRCFLGFYFRVPVIRTAHADSTAAHRLGRLFTFEDMMGVTPTSTK